MAQHPSLNAQFVEPDPIRAVAEMNPYVPVPCWCRSGKKYKFCHYQRERQPLINIYEVEEEMRREFNRGYCSYPKSAGDECSPGISNAHTVQRRGGLGAIGEAGHVLSVKPSMKAMIEHEGKPPPKRIGLGRASVFPGFCNKHDKVAFQLIEGENVAFEKTTALLFAYRAIAYERFAKHWQLKTIAIQREMDCGQPLWKRGVKIGMRDLEAWKSDYDSRIISGDLDGFFFYSVRFDRVLPIVGCGAFYPEFDLQGKALQRLGRPSFEFEHVAMNITVYQEQTVAFFCWLGEPDGPAGTFVKSFGSLSHNLLADALVRIAFEQMGNIYMRQSWWEASSNNDQAELLRRVWSGGISVGRRSDCLVDHGTAYASANIVETASS
jgi:hypothetical protein